jgi:ATP-dependent protease HslVU (ClpYQ) peptidase subunit
MTTIVVTRDAMYSDSRCTVGGMHFPCPKIFRHGKELIGTAGDNAGIETFLTWYAGKRKKPLERLKGSGFSVVVLNKHGIFAFGDCSFPDRVLRDFHAIGSGALCALGAMAAGADPRKAIEIACEYADGTGLPVQEFKLRAKA